MSDEGPVPWGSQHERPHRVLDRMSLRPAKRVLLCRACGRDYVVEGDADQARAFARLTEQRCPRCVARTLRRARPRPPEPPPPSQAELWPDP